MRAPEPSGRLRQWWLDRSLHAKALIVLAAPLFALVGITTADLALRNTERHQRGLIARESSLVSVSNRVLSDAVDAETGVRGYAATGDRALLASYNRSLKRINADRRSLRSTAIADSAGRQAAAVGRAVTTVLTDLALTEQAVSRGVTGGGLSALLREAKTIMDRLRAGIADLTAGPVARLVTDRRGVSRLEDAIGVVDLSGLILALVAAFTGAALFTSGISRRVAVAGANASRLGEGRPLHPVPPSKDELGRLATSLVAAERVLTTREADLTAARDEAVRATQAKNAFLSSTSHELRTPLNSIIGFAQLLQISDLTADDHDSVQRILGAGRQLLVLINGLIDIARIESGDLNLSMESVPVVPLIEEAARLMEPLAAGRSVRIMTVCDCPALAARADRQRFAQVLVNLVSNAVKYNKVGGSIAIACADADPAWVAITVTDTGRGISPGDLSRIFAPFERLGLERGGVEGTGIGLPLARALTEAMGGRLSVSSVAGEGSAFTMTLPRSADVVPATTLEPAQPQPQPMPPTESAGRGLVPLNVLYIEDNLANVEVVSRFLRGRLNAPLTSFPRGREGLDYAIANRPDIILLDLHLQDVHGERVLSELKARPATAGIPVVVLSADATEPMIKRLIEGGAYAYLTKPLDLTELGHVLDSLTGGTVQ